MSCCDMSCSDEGTSMKGAENAHEKNSMCARGNLTRSRVNRTTKINASFVRCDEVERLNSSSNPVSALIYWTNFAAMALSQGYKPRRRETRAFPGYRISEQSLLQIQDPVNCLN